MRSSVPIVHVVDDDRDMRDSLAWLMQSVGLEVETYDSARDFLDRFTFGASPGCLVFDVRMPGTSGLELYEALIAHGQSMPVVFITAYADVPMAIRAMKSGAVEFVEKPFNRQALLERVQRAVREDADRRQRIAERKAVEDRFRRLTDKENAVLELVISGMPNKSIAARLAVTPRAVEMRRASLMKKLGVSSLAELLRLTFARELVAENGRATSST
ncbi:MAG: response regulator [Planctomycetota bacterium]|nr:response regulator [Planctomycetota bacterium]